MPNLKHLIFTIAASVCCACSSVPAQPERLSEATQADVYDASCGGTVSCPYVGPCADWTYSVADDGTNSTVNATWSSPYWGTCSGSVVDPDLADAGTVVDGVSFTCGSSTISFGIDRATSVVYIHADPPGFAWTPSCQ